MKRCLNCGADNNDESVNCQACSNPLVAETTNNIIIPPRQEILKPPPPPMGYGSDTPLPMIPSKSSLGVVSMILGISSIVCCCCTPITLGLAIAAIITGTSGRNNPTADKGMALAGIITGIIGTILSVLITILFFVLMSDPDFRRSLED